MFRTNFTQISLIISIVLLSLLSLNTNLSAGTPLFACCFIDGTCLDRTVMGCRAQSGETQDNIRCDTADCPQPPPTGACCFTDGSCSVLTVGDCAAQGGLYNGDDTDCGDPNLCTGACCLGDGSCSEE